MDPNASPNVAQQPAIEPQTVAKPQGSAFNKILFVLLGILVLLGVAVGSYYLGAKNAKLPSGYNATVANIGSYLMAKPSQEAIPTPTPTPDPTAGWLVYTNAKYAYSIKYPQGLQPNEQNTYYHYVEFKSPSAAGSLPPYLVSVIPDTFVAKEPAAYNYMSSDWIASIANITVGGTKAMDSAAVFTRLADIKIAGLPAQVIEVTATGYKQHRVYVKSNGNIYMISNYYQPGDNLTDFQNFVSSFKFTQ